MTTAVMGAAEPDHDKRLAIVGMVRLCLGIVASSFLAGLAMKLPEADSSTDGTVGLLLGQCAIGASRPGQALSLAMADRAVPERLARLRRHAIDELAAAMFAIFTFHFLLATPT